MLLPIGVEPVVLGGGIEDPAVDDGAWKAIDGDYNADGLTGKKSPMPRPLHFRV